MHAGANFLFFILFFVSLIFLNRQIQLMNPETIPADDEPACYRDPYVSDFRFQVFHNYKGLG